MNGVILNNCLHCGGESAFEITSRPDTVKAYCKDCGIQTKAIGVSLEYSAKQKVADLWNANVWEPGVSGWEQT